MATQGNWSEKPVVIVTGASRGIGLAVVTILLEELDARVVGIVRSTNSSLDHLLEKHTDSLVLIYGDVTEPETSKRAVASALEQFGSLDSLILNAAVFTPHGTVSSIPVDSIGYQSPHPLEHPQDTWRHVFDVNWVSLKGWHGVGPYSASKAAVNSLARTLAKEEENLVVVAVQPGVVDTDMQGQVRRSSGMTPDDVQTFRDMHSEGKLVQPSDTGYVISSLALAANKELSGQYLNWDGEECQPYKR
ncbi:SubName: Full=Related to steroid dehydrogenase {ECO:0000313/EMBL:CCA67038.1} [Serendipita indica DSM 11827]|nr:SubName: Full=Related to steroid dehydrogenase {ECO:0000313/EMBL:CCA67038.1} [Serendipita indica DSM 11827]